MDDVVDKKLSELSRGFGTASGKLIRDTPIFSCTDSSDFELRKQKSSCSLDDLFLLRIEGSNESCIERLYERTYDPIKHHNTKCNQKALHKTYSTRGGNLILYTENLYQTKRRKKKRDDKDVKKTEFDDVVFKGTCEDLATSILKFGNGNFHFLKDGNKSLRDERVISVRPGYSPMRYVASASKLWDPGWVEKMLNEKAINESHLERYKKIEFPKIDVIPSSKFDPLLRERPKPYSRISLPDLFHKHKDDKLGADDTQASLAVDNTSSGYAKSVFSEGNLHERKKMRRKKTMQMNKLKLEMPEERLPKVEHDDYDDDDEERLSEWNIRRETSRNVIERTFDNLKEDFTRSISHHNDDYIKHGDGTGENGVERVGNEGIGGLKIDSSQASSIDSLTEGSFDYAALKTDQKEDLISRLLLQGITKEATDVDSLISNEGRDDIENNKSNKIDLSDRISLPVIQGTSIPDSQSSKGFKGNALHRSLPSANSSKSKTSKDGSVNTNSTGLVISSIMKLPPIKSEPSTPNINKKGDYPGELQQAKLPPIYRKSLAASKLNDEGEEDNLLINGRAIDINDVDIIVDDNKKLEQSLPGVGHALSEISEHGDQNTNDTESSGEVHENASIQDNLILHGSKPGHQSPDSGRSTGTGLTSLSDAAKVNQHENIPNKEPMTPVAEESSRASIASKSLSREGTLNRTSGSLKQKSFISEKSSLKGSSLAEQVQDSLLLIKGLGPDVVGDEDVFSQGMKSDSRESKQNENQKSGFISSNEDDETLIDEGVIVDEDNMKTQINETDDERDDELLRTRTSTNTKTTTESIDITLDDNTNHDDDIDSDHRDSEGSFMSSGLLHAQAKAAAHTALKRPKSGIDLIEDMKIASAAFGQLFEGNIRREITKSAKSRRSRAGSDMVSKNKISGSKDADMKRSISALSMMSAKRMNNVNIDQLKANVYTLESLIDKKLNQSSPREVLKQAEGSDKEKSMDENFGSEKSFPAASNKSDGISERDIKMDIIGYGSIEKSSTIENIEARRESEPSKQQVGETVHRKQTETDEEEFRLALNAIVDEVKDVKEKKASKPKKGRKVRTSEDKFNIIRDRTSASPPFYAGKPKENKAPKGLRRVNEKSSNESNAVSKNSKIQGKKGKKKTGKKENKVSDGKKKKGKNEINGNEIVNTIEDKVKDGDTADGKAKVDGKDFDKYDVPMTIKTAVEKAIIDNENTSDKPSLVVEYTEVKRGGYEGIADINKYDSDVRRDTLTETETYGSIVMSVNDDGNDDRVAAARAKGRQLAAEKRRLKVEQKRREREEAKKQALAEAERAEKLRMQEELEMQKRVQDYKKQKEEEDQEKTRKERDEIEKMRRLELQREKEKREREEKRKKKAAMATRLKIDEDLRRERERIAKQIEEEMRRQEEEKLKQMEEHERLEYERQKKLEEEERLRQEEKKQRLEKERRRIEEEELRIKMQKLEEFHRMLLERAKFWEGMKNSKWFLELNQRLTRAFTFSYFDLLPAMLFPFTDLRPFTPKEHSSKKLPTIPEEK